jgi:hypothetical protein
VGAVSSPDIGMLQKPSVYSLVSRLISKVLRTMILNPTSIPVGVALVIYNMHTHTVLDLSGTNHVNSMSRVSEIIYRFDALTKLPDGLLMEETINKCVEILCIRNSIQ